MNEDNNNKLVGESCLKSYLLSTTGTNSDIEYNPIKMDHCYSRPWNWRPETSLLRPTKTLFIPKLTRRTKKLNHCGAHFDDEEYIDVDTDPQQPPAIYDVAKAKYLMEECERYAGCARVNEGNEDWENTILRHTWTSAQHKLFNNMVKILNNDRAARLAHSGNWNEPILRRTVIDKSVKRTRQLMASISWDTRLTQWLHLLLLDNLSTSYLSAYLDILQTLRAKLPTFVDKMMFGPTASNRIGVTSNESLFPLLKRQWDPVASSLAQDKPKKLPGNPIIVIVPSSPTLSGPHPSKRLHKWTTLLNNLASVITVHANIGHRITMMNCADQMFAATRAKVQEIRSDCPGRPIILAGFNTGAAIACQIAQVEPTMAVICLGFPSLTTEGRRGEADDVLLDIQSPTLFIIGQNSYVTNQEDMEDLRERMRVETGLVVVGGADDYLRINKTKKRTEGITQSIVDRCVVDEVGEFIGSILLSPYPPAVRPQPSSMYHQNETSKRQKLDRKRNNSNCSSIDSEPPSPQPTKVARPVGRPPGSKKKLMLDPKPFPPQLIPGTSSPSIPVSPTRNTVPSPNSDTYTSDTASASSTNRSVSMSEDINLILPDSEIPLESNIKTLPSQITSNTSATTSASVPHLHGISQYASRSMITPSNSTLSSLLQAAPMPRISSHSGSIRTAGTGSNSSCSSIKVLENIKINPPTNKKSSGAAGRLIDMSKITVLNSLNAQKNNLGDVVLIPDKGIRNIPNTTTIKGTGGTPMMLPFTHRTPQPVQKRIPPPPRYITSKKQLLNQQQRMNTTTYLASQPEQQSAKLASPADLTTADIMDLPIIFADNDSSLLTDLNNQNSQLFSNTSQQDLESPAAPIVLTTVPVAASSNSSAKQNQSGLPQATISTTGTGKYVVINKQPALMATAQSVTYPAGTKRSLQQPPRAGPGVKFTKIILSKRGDDASSSSSNTSSGSNSNTARVQQPQVISKMSGVSQKHDDPMMIDLENELVATAVPKPQHHMKNEVAEKGKITIAKGGSGLLEAVLKRETPLKKPSLPPTSKTLNQLFQDLDSNNPDDPDAEY